MSLNNSGPFFLDKIPFPVTIPDMYTRSVSKYLSEDAEIDWSMRIGL